MSTIDITSPSTLPELTGQVTVQLINTETQEVEYEYTEPNIITFQAYGWLNGVAIGSPAPRIWISDRNVTKTASFAKVHTGAMTTLETATLTPTVFTAVIPKTIGTPYYAEFRAQFQPPTTTRTIYSLGINGSAASYGPFSIVSLTTPCTQTGSVPGPGQTLVVTYRIQVLPAASSVGSLPVARSADRYFAEMFAGIDYTTDGLNSIREGASGGFQRAEFVWNSNIPDNMGVNVLQSTRYRYHNGSSSFNASTINGTVTDSLHTTAGDNSSTVVAHMRYGSNVHTTNNINTWNVGSICGSIFYGGNESAAGFNAVYGMVGLYMAPAVANTWDPVQNIFNHGVDGTEPFQQISALATGTGSVNATAQGTWTNPSWPEYYRISINSMGNLGSARYTFCHRTMSGFTSNPSGTGVGSSWTTSAAPITIMPSQSISTTPVHQGVHSEDMTPTGSYHFKRVHPTTYEGTLGKIIRHTATSVVTWDFTGVTVYNIRNNTYTTFDGTTTPALPVSYIHQVSVDSQGNVWVACKNTGLWKISSTLMSVTNITTFATVTTTNVRAVDVGSGDKIFVIVEGGMFSSADYGITWTQEAFGYVGITDGNWNRVYWIRLQPNSPSYRMYIQTSSDNGATFASVWWSNASATAIAGPTWASTHLLSSVTAPTSIHHTRMLVVSRTGEMWSMTTQLGAYKLLWGTPRNLTIHDTLNSQYYTMAGFSDDPTYDYYGTPYTTGGYDQASVGVTTTQASGIPMFDPTLGQRGRYNRINNTNHMHPFIELSDGMYLTRGPSNNAYSFGIWSPCPNFATQEGAITTRLPKNIEHSHFEEMVWGNYQWNGSSWVNGYHAPALDTSGSVGGPFNGTRHRFNVESHAFTGRSCIVAPTSPLTSFFTTNLTFALQITPLSWLGSQGTKQQLFSWVNLTTDDSVRFYVNDGTNNVALRVGNNRSYLGYSTTFVTTGTGSKTFTVDAGLPYVTGMRLRVIARQTMDWMEGTVTSYSGTTLTLTVDSTSGSTNTYGEWTVDFVGIRFGSTPTYGNTSNIVLIINGTSASCYVNGTQLGTTQTIVSTNFGVSNAEFVVGGNRVNSVDGKGFDTAQDFYRGTMLNILIDSTPWSAGEVASHHVSPTTYTTATSRVRYQLSDNLTGLETKTTHGVNEELINGVYLRFTDGPSNSFVQNEYYTFGVCDGILKDNATSFTHLFNSYFLPVEHGFTDTDTPTIPSTTTPITEKVCFRWPSVSESFYAHPGYFIVGGPLRLDHGFQAIAGDFVYTGTIANARVSTDTDSDYFHFGLTDTINTSSSSVPRWTLHIKGGANRYIDVVYQGTVVASNVAIWNKGDAVSVERAGDVITFKHNSNTIFTTSGVQNYAGTVYPSGVSSPEDAYCVFVQNHTLTYNRPSYVVGIGNQANLTGKYDPSFHCVGAFAASRGSMTVNIAGYGTPATITVAGIDQYYSDLVASPPALNNVIVVPDAGYIICSPGDAGKAISIDCTIIKYNFT